MLIGVRDGLEQTVWKIVEERLSVQWTGDRLYLPIRGVCVPSRLSKRIRDADDAPDAVREPLRGALQRIGDLVRSAPVYANVVVCCSASVTDVACP